MTTVDVRLGVMSDAQRAELRTTLRGDAPANEIPFAQPGSRTRVYAVASGKGGVGKSSVTVNLAAALAQKGLSVGVLDADIYGFSVPRMLGVTGKPTQVDQMIMPPIAHGVKVISIGMFTPGNTAVVWRGPMLHRALQQFLADVFWGDLDVLLMDLPPGTGDIAISVAQLVPSAELLVVTTPQLAAREVAERAGSIALQTHQQIVGVVENMSWLELPDGSRMELFGSGGGQAVADSLATPDRHPGAAARPDPDRPAGARGRRRRHAGGAERPRLTGRGRAARSRRRARGPPAQPGRDARWASPRAARNAFPPGVVGNRARKSTAPGWEAGTNGRQVASSSYAVRGLGRGRGRGRAGASPDGAASLVIEIGAAVAPLVIEIGRPWRR